MPELRLGRTCDIPEKFSVNDNASARPGALRLSRRITKENGATLRPPHSNSRMNSPVSITGALQCLHPSVAYPNLEARVPLKGPYIAGLFGRNRFVNCRP